MGRGQGPGPGQNIFILAKIFAKQICFENQERVLSPKPESDMVLEDLEQQVNYNHFFLQFTYLHPIHVLISSVYIK